MVNVPGSVPLRGTLPFIEWDVYDTFRIEVDPSHQLRAWSKLLELQRRWLHFEWFTHAAAKRPDGVRTLINDAATAYLMTFEAVLQIVGEELFNGDGRALNAWLESLSPDPYDLTCRGLRTMRHLEAHVRPGNLAIVGQQLGNSVFSGASWGHTLPWCFADLEPGDFGPRRRPLDLKDRGDWNAHVRANLAASLMREGVRRSSAILLEAEKLVP